MKPRRLPLVFGSAGCAALLLSAASHGLTIFTDTFDSGTGNWYRAGSAGVVSNAAGQLSWAPATSSGTAVREVVGRSFPTITLADGDFVRLTVDYTQNSATTALADIYRLGIYDFATPVTVASWSQTTNIGAYSGYSGFFRDNSATGNVLRYESATDTSDLNTGPTVTTATDIGSDNDTFNVVPGTQYKLSFELTRVSATQMDVLYQLTSMDGLTIHQILSASTSNVVSTFDAVVFRSLSGANYSGSLIDNATLVSSVPEPGAALLGGLGLLALLRRRRA
jgi:MYXO-CTERM domain-containing protein